MGDPTQPIFNEDTDIDQQFNAQQVGQLHITNIYGGDRHPIMGKLKSEKEGEEEEDDDSGSIAEDKQASFGEYITDLPESPSLAYQFTASDIPDQWLAAAQNNRILLLDCPDKKLLHAATYAFIERFEQSANTTYEKKHVDAEQLHRDTSVAPEIQAFLTDEIKENQIVVLDVTLEDLTVLFLESVKGRFVKRDIATATLQRKNNLLLVKIDGREISDTVFDDMRDYIWEVPFLSYLLRKHNCLELEELIEQQRQRGLWPQRSYTFHHELKGYLSQDSLASACEKKGVDLSEEALRKKRKDEKKKMRTLLEKEKKPLRQYLIFLVAFFRDITDDDLDALLRVLTQEDKKLRKAYEKGYKKLLKECHIQRISKSEDDYVDIVLEFVNLDYRDQAIRYFFLEDFHFVRNQCNTLLRYGFLLQKGPSYHAYRGIVGLIGRVSKASTGYGFKLLKYLIAAIMAGHTSVNLEIAEYDIDEIFVRGLENSKSEYKALIENTGPVFVDMDTFNIIKRRRIGYTILAEVILEMSHHDRLGQDLRQFYHFLIASKQHVAAFEVIRILRHSTKVDRLEWIRQLIDNGDASIKDKAYEYLITLAPQDPAQLQTYLERIHDWLPTRSDPNTFSHANKYALKFIWEYANFTYLRLKMQREHFGRYPTFYTLLGLLQIDEETEQYWLPKIIEWLSHPGVVYAWNEPTEEVEQTKKRYYFSIGNLLENWYAVLHGLGPEPEHQENMDLFDRILDLFIPIAMKDRLIYLSLLDNWTKKGKYYEQKMRQLIRRQSALEKSTTDHSTMTFKQSLAELEEEKTDFAARRFLLIQKFIPTVKAKMDKGRREK